MANILEVVDLKKYYPMRKGFFAKGLLRAVDGVSFTIQEGETLGLVGQSGSGKSTLAKCILRLEEPTVGRILLNGHDITALRYNELRFLRKDMQMVFQDPLGSLNPRSKVGEMIAEPQWLFGLFSRKVASAKTAGLLGVVGLSPEHAGRYPHQLSGGQQQRVGIARAIAPNPRLIVLDEPTSSLDVSVQANILNLLGDLQRQLGLAFLFISHDLAVVSSLSSRVAVMHMGKIVEIGPAQQIFSSPQHSHTRALLAAMPVSHPRQRRNRVGLESERASQISVTKDTGR